VAEPRARCAHEQHGRSAGAGLCGATPLFRLHHSLNLAPRLLAFDFHRFRGGGRAARTRAVSSRRAGSRRRPDAGGGGPDLSQCRHFFLRRSRRRGRRAIPRPFQTRISGGTRRAYVTNLFGQHVSPQVVDRLLAAGSTTSSDTRQVAVMFVDIRGFTAAARARTPQEVVDRLDAAFTVLVEIVDRNGGIVNKFLGDGFLALFGAPLDDPDAPRRAVAAAREMLAAIEQHNIRSDWPLRIGIGLHLGHVVAGNVGSPRRKEYTVIGDTVNLASRIEGLNKEFGSQLLISDTVKQAIGQDVDAIALGDVPIRGYEQPVRVWRLA